MNYNESIIHMCERLLPEIQYIARKCHVPASMWEDAISEGKMAVIENMEKYDPNKSTPETFFRVYITHNIYYYMQKNFYHSNSYYTKKIQLLKTLKEECLTKNVSFSSLTKKYHIKDASTTLSHIERVKQHHFQPENDEVPSQNSVEEEAIFQMNKELLYDCLDKIGERAKGILTLKYGLYNTKPKPVAFIAKKYDIPYHQVFTEIEKSIVLLRHLMKVDA